MQLDTRKILEDIRLSAAEISNFIADKTFEDYMNDSLLRRGVERDFEIIGEALNRLFKINADVLKQISNYEHIISFRNILIHGYDVVEDPIVWDVLTTDLPVLYDQVKALLGE